MYISDQPFLYICIKTSLRGGNCFGRAFNFWRQSITHYQTSQEGPQFCQTVFVKNSYFAYKRPPLSGRIWRFRIGKNGYYSTLSELSIINHTTSHTLNSQSIRHHLQRCFTQFLIISEWTRAEWTYFMAMFRRNFWQCLTKGHFQSQNSETIQIFQYTTDQTHSQHSLDRYFTHFYQFYYGR